MSVPGASAKKSGRPLAVRTVEIRDAIVALTADYDVMTVRQVFYALVSRGIVEKDETRGYRPVQRQVLELRQAGILPWSFISDATRWQRRPTTYTDAQDALRSIARTYRRNLWRDQGYRIEVWLEKDALAGVISDVTDAWDVPLMVSRGVSSATFLHSAVEWANTAYRDSGHTTVVMLLYDFDAGGDRAARTTRRYFDEYAAAPIEFVHLALRDDQVRAWGLPTRPAKKSDPEASKWGNVAVELDAIPPDQLQQLVKDAIVTYIDADAWALVRRYEESEHELLLRIAEEHCA